MPLSQCSQCGADVIHGRPPPPPQELDIPSPSPGTRRHTLLHSNDVPLEGEAAVIGAELVTLDDRLHCLDDESLRLREELGRLEEERVLVSKHRTQNRSILSAIRRVPPEILGHIFSWTLPGTAESLRTVVHLKESPWTLSHVSRYWRAVALSESSLWSTVALDYDRAPLYPLSMVETQVARAKKLKVHFYGCEAFDTVLQIETFRFLAQYAPRWEELSLGLAPHIAPLLSALRDRVPLLRIFFPQWEWQNALTIDRVDCLNAPSLVRAWVSSHFQSIPVLFPAHHLTGYELYSSWDTHADILKHTRNLVVARISVEFGGEDNSWRDPRSQEIINLTRLRRLFVSHAEILNFLRVPALEEAAINCDDDEGPNILGALRSAVSRSSCVFRRLCFWGLPLLPSTIEILSQFPSIVDFAVMVSIPGDGPLAGPLMERLTVTADGTVIAPQLCRISFACEEYTSIAHGIYLDMITSRWKAGGFKTSEVLVASGPRLDAVVLRGIEKLREEGFNLVYLEGKDAADVITTWTFEPEWDQI